MQVIAKGKLQASKRNHRKLTADSDGGDQLSLHHVVCSLYKATSHTAQVASPSELLRGDGKYTIIQRKVDMTGRITMSQAGYPKQRDTGKQTFKACLQF